MAHHNIRPAKAEDMSVLHRSSPEFSGVLEYCALLRTFCTLRGSWIESGVSSGGLFGYLPNFGFAKGLSGP